MAHIKLTVSLRHDLPANEMHRLAIDTLAREFAVTDDHGITVLDASYLGEDDDDPEARFMFSPEQMQ